jgi:hypothetical protein
MVRNELQNFVSAIMYSKTRREKRAIDVVDSIASHLHHPFLSRMLGYPGKRDPSRFQVQEKENVICR